MDIQVKPRKALALLMYLAVTADRHSRDSLATLLWPSAGQRQARKSLRGRLSELNLTLGGDWIQADRETVGLRAGYWLDVAEFQRILADKPPDSQTLIAAANLYRDDFLTGFTLTDCPEFDEWQFFQSQGLRQALASALKELVDLLSDQAEYEVAILYARRWLALDPLHEPAQRQLMLLYAQAGQQAAALRQYELGRKILEEELDISPAPETTALYNAIRRGKFIPSSTIPPAPTLHNLPIQTTTFVGREREMADIRRLLLEEPGCRLLTLVGSGGIGKTRLALAAVGQTLNAFPDGVYFVTLAPVDGVEFIIPTIAEALRFSFYESTEPMEQLLGYLRQKRLLLVVDNVEHLLDGIDILSDILRYAPDVTLLATSRERLNLQEEWVYEVGGLAFPTTNHQASTIETAHSAVELFTERARQVVVDFAPTAAEMADIAQICQLVDGMPLGLELAAPWIRTLSFREIVHEIKQSLDFLTTTLRNVPERHRSLRVVFDQTWNRLSPAEQSVLMQLSLFRGGWTREAAEHVASIPDASHAIVTVLSSLVDKALLQRTDAGRYEIHQLLRQYAAEKLSAVPATQTAAHDRHCRYYTMFLQQQEVSFRRPGEAEAIAAIGAEIDNVHSAWRLAVSQAKLDEINRSIKSLSRFYLLRGPFQEGRTLLGRAEALLRKLIDLADEPEHDFRDSLGNLLVAQARLLRQQAKFDQAIEIAREIIGLAQSPQLINLRATGYFLWGQSRYYQGDYKAARTHLKHALALARDAQMRLVEADSLRLLGLVSWNTGDYPRARSDLELALVVHREIGDQQGEGKVLTNLGLVAQDLGDYGAARIFFDRAITNVRQIGNRWNEATVLLNLGTHCLNQGDYTEAKAYFEEALAIHHEIGNLRGEAMVIGNLGLIAHRVGDYATARLYYEQDLHIHNRIGDRHGQTIALYNLSLLAHHRNDNEVAREYSQQGLLIARELGARRNQGYGLTFLGHALAAMGNLTEAAEVYHQALTLRRELGEFHLAMEPLAGLAHVFLLQEELTQAHNRVEEILNYLKHNSLEGAEEPFRIYLTCYQVLEANGDPRAIEILNSAYDLLKVRTNRVLDEAMRFSFLENVAVHREIVSEFYKRQKELKV